MVIILALYHILAQFFLRLPWGGNGGNITKNKLLNLTDNLKFPLPDKEDKQEIDGVYF